MRAQIPSKVFVDEKKAAMATPSTKAKGSKDGKIPEDPKDDEDKDREETKAKGRQGKARTDTKKAPKTTLAVDLPVDDEEFEDAVQDAPKIGKDGDQAKEKTLVSL